MRILWNKCIAFSSNICCKLRSSHIKYIRREVWAGALLMKQINFSSYVELTPHLASSEVRIKNQPMFGEEQSSFNFSLPCVCVRNQYHHLTEGRRNLGVLRNIVVEVETATGYVLMDLSQPWGERFRPYQFDNKVNIDAVLRGLHA